MSSQTLASRRGVLIGAAALAAAQSARAFYGDKDKNPRYTAAIIGHTGRGDYGHGVDVIFNDRDNIEGRRWPTPTKPAAPRRAAQRGRKRTYADYREMLEQGEAPTRQHRPALDRPAPRDGHGGAGGRRPPLSSKSPSPRPSPRPTRSSPLADKKKLKIAVAHQMRLAPPVSHLKQRIDGRFPRRPVEIRAWGKQDRNRAGGEDMIVLGTHLFDLMRLFAGDPQCVLRPRPLQRQRHHQRRRTKSRPKKSARSPATTSTPSSISPAASSPPSPAAPACAPVTGHWGLELIGTAPPPASSWTSSRASSPCASIANGKTAAAPTNSGPSRPTPPSAPPRSSAASAPPTAAWWMTGSAPSPRTATPSAPPTTRPRPSKWPTPSTTPPSSKSASPSPSPTAPTR